ncbi:MAG: flavodoxin domain-containing protein, partial [Amphiplicatus sp.]
MRALAAFMGASLLALWLADFAGGRGADPAWLLAVKAAVVLGFFALFVRAVVRRGSAGKAAAASSILVAHASQTGIAEELARRTAEMLTAGGRDANVVDIASLDAARLAAQRTALFVASTTGEGDAPDSAGRFAALVMSEPAALADLQYAVLALGDRGYTDYCGFGRRLDAWLAASGASALFERLDVDRGDERAIAEWFARLGGLGAAGADTDAFAFSPWRLAERRILNPGSDNPPVFHVALEPVGELPDWKAGDIAVIAPRSDAAPVGGSPVREYSLASLSSDNRAELVVRQMRGPDGGLGLGSGWLTERCAVGGEVAMRLRVNRSFRGPDDARPVILLGAGSGIAGLRAHIKERAAAGHTRNWLLFGERDREKDYLYRDEIEAWRAGGVLARLDLGFMREDGE